MKVKSHRDYLFYEFLESEYIRRIDCSTRSPDINPMELVFDTLKKIDGVAIYHPCGNFAELNRTVTCMVLKAYDRRTSSPCHDEFRGPRSDYV
ncbi:hypothetical protein TNCV_2204771 [Trichonephila clavipes]|nr:hypothetical protein TNCV_2204771 [Trichonephila clavipes]